ncbi:MAG TPA: dihydrofolate reductase family protein [Actinocrinis sp.]|nr:dihydrofolate reductase family protein [Actinocrinis sp.]
MGGIEVNTSSVSSASLMEHDLVDEYRFLIHPVLLGRGRGLVADGARRVNLDLVESVATSSGVTIRTYRPVR